MLFFHIIGYLCVTSLCAGDRYGLYNDRPLCEDDFRQISASSMTSLTALPLPAQTPAACRTMTRAPAAAPTHKHTSQSTTSPYRHLAHADYFPPLADDRSSGYGSPSPPPCPGSSSIQSNMTL